MRNISRKAHNESEISTAESRVHLDEKDKSLWKSKKDISELSEAIAKGHALAADKKRKDVPGGGKKKRKRKKRKFNVENSESSSVTSNAAQEHGSDPKGGKGSNNQKSSKGKKP
jgi:hypothetical protein